jgi:hypothetical protein
MQEPPISLASLWMRAQKPIEDFGPLMSARLSSLTLSSWWQHG